MHPVPPADLLGSPAPQDATIPGTLPDPVARMARTTGATGIASPLQHAVDEHLREMVKSAARTHLDGCVLHQAHSRGPRETASLVDLLAWEALSYEGQLSAEERRQGPPLSVPESTWWRIQGDDFVQGDAAPSLPPDLVCCDLARQALGTLQPSATASDMAGLRQAVAALERRFGLHIPRPVLFEPTAPGAAPVVLRDASLLGRHLWRRLHPDGKDRDGWWLQPPADVACQGVYVEIDASRWARILERRSGLVHERPVAPADLVAIQVACPDPSRRLADCMRERIMSNLIHASTAREQLAIPPAWIVSQATAGDFLRSMSDEEVLSWLNVHRVSPISVCSEALAQAAVLAWRHALVIKAFPWIGKALGLRALGTGRSSDLSTSCGMRRRLAVAVMAGDTDRMRDVVRGVLGAVGTALSPDEALAILWPDRDNPPPLMTCCAADKWPRVIDTHLDDLAQAAREGRLDSSQIACLLGATDGQLGLSHVDGGYGDNARRLARRLGDLVREGLLTSPDFQRILEGAPDRSRGFAASFTSRLLRHGDCGQIEQWFKDLRSFWQQRLLSPQQAASMLLAGGPPSTNALRGLLALLDQPAPGNASLQAAKLGLLDAAIGAALEDGVIATHQLADLWLSHQPLSPSALMLAATHPYDRVRDIAFRRLEPLTLDVSLPEPVRAELVAGLYAMRCPT